MKIVIYLNLFTSTQKEQLVKISPVLCFLYQLYPNPYSFLKTFGKNDMKINNRQIPSLGLKTIMIKIELTLLANIRRSSATAYITGKALQRQKSKCV